SRGGMCNLWFQAGSNMHRRTRRKIEQKEAKRNSGLEYPLLSLVPSVQSSFLCFLRCLGGKPRRMPAPRARRKIEQKEAKRTQVWSTLCYLWFLLFNPVFFVFSGVSAASLDECRHRVRIFDGAVRNPG